jgi:AcrR family transcriptional regulator
MPYSEKTIERIANAPKTLGNQLGRWCVYRDFSVLRVAKALGVTRQTVYNWFEGGDIFPAYQHRADTMLRILQAKPTADEAWREICRVYDLNP